MDTLWNRIFFQELSKVAGWMPSFKVQDGVLRQ